MLRPYIPRKQEDQTRVNNRIRVPQVRVIDENGEQLGVIATQDAMQRAFNVGLDLVEVSPTADPPVCRIMDYGKFKYEKSKKQKEAKKKQHIVHLKEIKLHPKTDDHDYNFKKEHARNFLIRGDRVKATVVFRGREITHTEFGREILDKLATDLLDLAVVELNGKMEGRNMISMYTPDKIKVKDYLRKIEQQKKRDGVAGVAAAQPSHQPQQHRTVDPDMVDDTTSAPETNE